MFTGIIEALGTVTRVTHNSLEIEAPFEGIEVGESIAVNGCCLTAVADAPLRFDVSPETWRRTSLGALHQGGVVNIERSMAANGRFGGHIVQGHVDATGAVARVEPSTPDHEFVTMRIEGPAEYARYLIDKGSVAVDGISLTVVKPVDGAFDVYLIPHTLANTNLHAKRAGDRVNLEYDLIAKYVERLMG